MGNFGSGFFAPLVSANAAETLFDIGITFEQTLIVALFASIFNVGLVLSREAQKYGKK